MHGLFEVWSAKKFEGVECRERLRVWSVGSVGEGVECREILEREAKKVPQEHCDQR